MTPVRFGILGAAHIAPSALVRPARTVDGAEVVAIAARSPDRARAFALANDVPDVSDCYDALIARSDIDAVYIALPASAHRLWAGRALEGGKHVLCEKPIALNAKEAGELAEISERTGRLLVEAFHYRHHPYMSTICEIVTSGELGSVVRIEAAHNNRVPESWSVYWDPSLGGGSTLHTGCYPVHCVRSVLGEEPEVTAARAEWVDGVDASLTAEMRFPSGVIGRIESSMNWARTAENWLRVVGTSGVLNASNFIVPHFGEHLPSLRSVLSVRTHNGTRSEAHGGPPTYDFQLEAFVRAARNGSPPLTGPSDAVANMKALDSMLDSARGARS